MKVQGDESSLTLKFASISKPLDAGVSTSSYFSLFLRVVAFTYDTYVMTYAQDEIDS